MCADDPLGDVERAVRELQAVEVCDL